LRIKPRKLLKKGPVIVTDVISGTTITVSDAHEHVWVVVDGVQVARIYGSPRISVMYNGKNLLGHQIEKDES
jgi:hypothetical protein